MTSPNSRMSMGLLKIAIQAIENVRNDLKNDDDLRNDGTVTTLLCIEGDLHRLVEFLKLKGYSK